MLNVATGLLTMQPASPLQAATPFRGCVQALTAPGGKRVLKPVQQGVALTQPSCPVEPAVQVRCFSFGAPKCGNRKFVRALQTLVKPFWALCCFAASSRLLFVAATVAGCDCHP